MPEFILRLAAIATLTPALLYAEVTDVNPQSVQAMTDQGALIIDVRTPEEWKQTGLIPGSHPLTFFDSEGNSDPQQWLNEMRKLKTKDDQPVVLVCRSGKRSAAVAQFLDQKAGMTNIYNLNNGITGWRSSGHPTRSCEGGTC